MKLIHLGDLHIGKSLNEYSLIEDQKYILNELINLIDRKISFFGAEIYQSRAIMTIGAYKIGGKAGILIVNLGD